MAKRKNKEVMQRFGFITMHKKDFIWKTFKNVLIALFGAILIPIAYSILDSSIFKHQQIAFFNFPLWIIPIVFIALLIILEIRTILFFTRRKVTLISNDNQHGTAIKSEGLNGYKHKSDYVRGDTSTIPHLKEFNLDDLLSNKYRGFVAGSKSDRTIVVDIETGNHYLVLASTNSGKTQTILLPSIWLLSVPIGKELTAVELQEKIRGLSKEEAEAFLKSEDIFKNSDGSWFHNTTKQESFLVTDPKAEISEIMYEAMVEFRYDVFVLNTLDLIKSNGFNCLELIFNLSKEIKELQKEYSKKKRRKIKKAIITKNSLKNKYITALASICTDDPQAKEPFWSKSAYASLVAYIYLVDELLFNQGIDFSDNLSIKKIEQIEQQVKDFDSDASEEEQLFLLGKINELKEAQEEIMVEVCPLNMTSVLIFCLDMLTQEPKDEFGDYENRLDELFMQLPAFHPARLNYSILKTSAGQTRASIMTTMLVQLSIFFDPAIATMQAKSQINLEKLDEGRPKAIFVVVPDDDKSKHQIVSLFIEQIYQSLRNTARSYRWKKLKRRFNIIGEEIANVASILDFSKKLSVARGSNIRFMLVLQDDEQLEPEYGEKENKTIINNCNSQVFLSSNNEDTISNYSKKTGTKTVLESSETYEYGKAIPSTMTYNYVEKPNVSEQELREIQFTQAFVYTLRYPVAPATMIPWYLLKDMVNFNEGNGFEPKNVEHFNLDLEDLVILDEYKDNDEEVVSALNEQLYAEYENGEI